ncbi:hypothetical protein M8494_34050 (plasmid) [Serratia ureilytica]
MVLILNAGGQTGSLTVLILNAVAGKRGRCQVLLLPTLAGKWGCCELLISQRWRVSGAAAGAHLNAGG